MSSGIAFNGIETQLWMYKSVMEECESFDFRNSVLARACVVLANSRITQTIKVSSIHPTNHIYEAWDVWRGGKESD